METYQLIYTVTNVSEWKEFFSQFNDNIIISCSKDTISMIDVDTWKEIKEIEIKNARYVIKMNENTLLIGKKRKYGIYNLKTKEYIKITHSHELAVQKLLKLMNILLLQVR